MTDFNNYGSYAGSPCKGCKPPTDNSNGKVCESTCQKIKDYREQVKKSREAKAYKNKLGQFMYEGGMK